MVKALQSILPLGVRSLDGAILLFIPENSGNFKKVKRKNGFLKEKRIM